MIPNNIGGGIESAQIRERPSHYLFRKGTFFLKRLQLLYWGKGENGKKGSSFLSSTRKNEHSRLWRRLPCVPRKGSIPICQKKKGVSSFHEDEKGRGHYKTRKKKSKPG